MASVRRGARPTPGCSVPPAPVPPLPDADAGAGRENRQVERSAHIELAAPTEDLDRVGEGIAQIADRRDGFVLGSSLSTGQGGAAGGTFEVRVPVDELEATIAELSRLAEVRSLTQSGQDLTAQVVTTGKAAERARAKRAELEDRLAVEEDAEDERRLRQRIDTLTAELRSARQQGRDLERRASFASVSLTLVEGEGAQGRWAGRSTTCWDSWRGPWRWPCGSWESRSRSVSWRPWSWPSPVQAAGAGGNRRSRTSRRRARPGSAGAATPPV